MIIYACDTTAKTASVALTDGKRLLAEYTLNCGNTHSETLVPMTDTMLKTMRMSVADIDMFACSAGPGSFTGVRIGVANIKGLAFGTGKPCIGVSTLEALAVNMTGSWKGIVCPVMDARRRQFYTAFFKVSANGVERLTPDRVVPCSQLEDECRSLGEKVRICGDGASVASSLMDPALFDMAPERLLYQSAYSVALSALRSYESGIRTGDAELRPVYLRLPQAERDRLERINAANSEE